MGATHINGSQVGVLTTVSDTQVASDAAIALSKLAALTASRAPVLDASGVLTASAVTATELGRLSGVTSSIQSQLDAYAPTVITCTADSSKSVALPLTARCLIVADLTVSTDDAEILIRTDSDGGASFDSGASDYSYANFFSFAHSTSGTANSNAAAQMSVNSAAANGATGNATGEGIVLTLHVEHKGSASRWPQLRWDIAGVTPTPSVVRGFGAGSRKAAAAITHIQIYPEAGTFTGTIRVYPIRD